MLIATQKTAPSHIVMLQPFKASNFTGRSYGNRGCMETAGRLDSREALKFYAVSEDIRYVVWSYATPIAWWSRENGWYKVRQKFSAATTRHQKCLQLVEERG